jgi:hypothetical protein
MDDRIVLESGRSAKRGPWEEVLRSLDVEFKDLTEEERSEVRATIAHGGRAHHWASPRDPERPDDDRRDRKPHVIVAAKRIDALADECDIRLDD